MFLALKQYIKTPIRSLLANKVRSFLTILGIIIGVSAVIIIVAIGGGAQRLILAQVATFGSDKIGVLPGNSEGGLPASAMGIAVTSLKYDDMLAIKNKNNVPNVVDAVAYLNGVANVTWESNSYVANISGTTASYPDVEDAELQDGRFFTESEEKSLSNIAVLGSTVKTELFGDSDALGRTIKIKKHTFHVIGVMKEKGSIGPLNFDDNVFIPIFTMQKKN